MASENFKLNIVADESEFDVAVSACIHPNTAYTVKDYKGALCKNISLIFIQIR